LTGIRRKTIGSSAQTLRGFDDRKGRRTPSKLDTPPILFLGTR
jgi:hypothetical protein